MKRGIIYDLFNVTVKAQKIKEDGELRQKSVRFAVSAIIYSLVMTAFAAAGGFLLSFDAGGLIIFTMVIGIAMLFCVLLCFIAALVRVIAQFSLNRKAMSWIALCVLIAAVAASVVIVLKFIAL